MTESTVSHSPMSASPEIAQAEGGEPGGGKERTASLWADAWRELRRNPIFIISAIVVLAIVSMAAFPQLWTNQSPDDAGFFSLTDARQPPSEQHLFGTSIQGGDLYTMLIYGARPSIVIGVVGALGIGLLGVLFGTIAGYYGGVIDTVISRAVDIVLGLPFLLGAIVLLSIFRTRNVAIIALVLILLGWTTMTRVMRGSVLQTKTADFVEAARALGARDRLIIWRHILPNALAPAIVLITINVGVLVGVEATLTFLGIGLQPPTQSWGIEIAAGQVPALNGYPHLLIFPCAILIVTVLSFILLGDALRDALDPKTR